MYNLGQHLESIYEEERDAGLGNGGLGRLAACFMDSLATLDYPAWGYGLRYTYGMFQQEIKDGEQKEFPDYWLIHGNPWEVERLDVVQPVKFFGHCEEIKIGGKIKFIWEGGEEVLAVAYDTPIPGYRTYNTLNIRLWSATPSREFDLENFNKGDFYKSIEERQKAETITHVLYPNDNTEKGKELRLKQQYFFVCATIGDLIRRFKKKYSNFQEFPNKVAVQLNDTHPALGIVELLRVLIDIEDLEWEEAIGIVKRTFSYTNHTVLPEALEKWPVSLVENLLPRHMRLIYQINLHFLDEVQRKWPHDIERMREMSIIQEHPYRAVRMANLAIVMSHTVNGVAELHSKLLVEKVFPYFYEFFGADHFQNKTNGVTPRRWLYLANPDLSLLISACLRSEAWILNLSLLSNLRAYADNEQVLNQWYSIKRTNKIRLAKYVTKKLGVSISHDALFDVQIKRIHEYKRQLMNILYVIYRYHCIKQLPVHQRSTLTKRVIFFAGKAAPGYFMAKRVIKLINCVANVVNNDKSIGDILKIVFIPNYSVSLAEIIIPASDISQHISTAGMEASGTSNMKFSMNGGIILGTLDGANIEILEEVGKDNIFIFGAIADDVPSLREEYKAGTIDVDPRFNLAISLLKNGDFGPVEQFVDIINSITPANDFYLIGYDFSSYIESQDAIDIAFKDRLKWTRMSLMNTAGSGKFSSDRTIEQYAREIWKVKKLRRPGPTPISVDRLSTSRGIFPDNESNVINLERFSPSVSKLSKARQNNDNVVTLDVPKKVTYGFEI